MKKSIFILSLSGIIFLFSFSDKNTFNPSVKSVTKLRTFTNPCNLSAVKNGSSVTIVTADCTDGTYSTSGPVTVNF